MAAILRIGASLDPDTVLREVVGGARTLTGARYGVIAAVVGQIIPPTHRASWSDYLPGETTDVVD